MNPTETDGTEAHRTRYWYDTEFLEDGRTIELISIGIVAEDGREYYAVNEGIVYDGGLQRRIKANTWLMANVVSSLPQRRDDTAANGRWLFDYDSPLVKPRAVVADEIRDFLLTSDTPELWADYGAYDHVVLCQLWGSMVCLPVGLPMYTNDIQQEAHRLGVADLPQQDEGLHNALTDARHCRTRWEFLRTSCSGVFQ
ncbi:3'-5' exoribonuclease domain-containing protein [Actinocrispum wychmicini]|uniref:Uncharacterized protein DUF5051 n=1 Tax=Actinocrispum wychmicini TaxID=1213861 RepID=A0A4R2JSM0_9PSEU|nr:3'-5' exoribonuclease [Actinocrispum wychmicini]TCO57165.1 uncharacterized protein DUF5051 [Actinocrispum wychmicini]